MRICPGTRLQDFIFKVLNFQTEKIFFFSDKEDSSFLLEIFFRAQVSIGAFCVNRHHAFVKDVKRECSAVKVIQKGDAAKLFLSAGKSLAIIRY